MAILRVGDGSDGDLTVSTDKNINTDLITGSRSYADGVFFRVNAVGANYATIDTTPNGLSAGDNVIIVNIMGRTSNYDNAGNYEIFTVDYISSNDVYFTQPINEFYGDDGGNGNITSHPVMLQRVPQYNNVTINSAANLNCSDCPNGNNVIGGMVVFKCAGTLNIVNGYVHANEKGFGGSDGTPNGYGTGFGYGYDNAVHVQTDGGGGGYGTAGTSGYRPGGIAYGVADLSKIMSGSGGGNGWMDPVYNQLGGDGGGIVFIMALNIIISTGGIHSKGQSGEIRSIMGGGGGSGGSVLIHAGNVTIPNGGVLASGGPSYRPGAVGRMAIYYQSGSLGTLTPTPYTDTIELPYKISGTIAGGPAQYLRIYDIDSGELLNTYSGIANGAYEVDAPGDGPYDIMARKSNGKILSYGEVTPTEI